MTPHPSHLPVSSMSSTSPEPSWVSDSGTMYSNETMNDQQTPPVGSSGLLRGFNSMQKKVTRDGQPAKRRGPKPDSKPAQTRRQELNRQAQRTHRERKEQYIKALESEVARLREAFAHEAAHANNMMKQNELVLHESQQEIMILRDMLASRGVPFEGELESRKTNARITGRDASSLSPTHMSPPRVVPAPYQGGIPGPSSNVAFSTHERMYPNGSTMSASGHSPGTTHHSHSPSGPEVAEQSNMGSPEGVPDMPGIFEKDPQLGVDFILALEATCRDHGEYLVRRSNASPNDPEEALFSGHALMASCPPPSHIEQVAAQQGGLQPTYPHQAPQVPYETLQTLLNLSQKIKADGFVEGGQVTPIMALQSLRGHRNYGTLTRDDVVGMIESIKNKVRCYGFGAVMEDFELRDALSTIFATKPEAYDEAYNGLGQDEIDEMYS